MNQRKSSTDLRTLRKSSDTGPQFDRHANVDQSTMVSGSNRGGSGSRRNSKFFTLTEKAIRLANAAKSGAGDGNNNDVNRRKSMSLKDSVALAKSARVAIDNICMESYGPTAISYSPTRSAVAQLVDLEEEMARDDFDYNVFRKKEVKLFLF